MIYPCSFEKATGRTLDELPSLQPGAWRKVRTLGEANYGKVYLVESSLPDMPKAFAVKQMRKADVLNGTRGVECARNEIHAALALCALSVPYTAEILGAAQDEKYFYLALEYCEHGELFAVLHRAGYIQSEKVLREIMFQVLLALRALHDAGIAHRDVSLENVLVTEDGSLRLVDYGQAILVHAPGENAKEAPVPQSRLGLPGKPNYRPPEVSAGAPYLAKKMDTFACGVMLYTLAVGSYPFTSADDVFLFPSEEADADRCSRLGAQLELFGYSDRVSPALLDLLEQMLAPNPDKRATIEEALAHPWVNGTMDGFWMDASAVDDLCDSGENSDSGDMDSMNDIDCNENSTR